MVWQNNIFFFGSRKPDGRSYMTGPYISANRSEPKGPNPDLPKGPNLENIMYVTLIKYMMKNVVGIVVKRYEEV